LGDGAHGRINEILLELGYFDGLLTVDTRYRKQVMDRISVLALLTQHKAELARRFGVTDLALFGSTARGAARPDSDVDVLVTFDGPATSQRYFGVQFYLEDLLGCTIDLVTDKALRAELRPHIEREAVHV
jgi:predicted nucleotidyltransferase